MTNILIGNIIGFIASILMVCSGMLKEKKKILCIQTIQIGLSSLGNFILGGFNGAIINVIGCIKNILYSKNKLGFKEKIIITLLATILSIIFNNSGIIGMFPLINTIFYMWLMNQNNIIKFKFLIIITALLWLIYDFSIKSYISAIFNFMYIFANIIAIIQIIMKTKKMKERKV